MKCNRCGKPAADGPRYKALGNSWAVPCARWIGERIEAVEALSRAGLHGLPQAARPAHALHQVNLMAKANPDLWGMLPAEVMESK